MESDDLDQAAIRPDTKSEKEKKKRIKNQVNGLKELGNARGSR